MKTIPVDTRKRLFEKMGGRCGYCGQEMKYDHMTVDHKTPLSKGGSRKEKNLLVCCQKCNSLKASLTVDKFRKRVSGVLRDAARFGFAVPCRQPVIFYFEKLKNEAKTSVLFAHSTLSRPDE